MKSTIKTIIAISAIAVLAACGDKQEAGGPNIEMPAVGQPKPAAQPVIDAPQAEPTVTIVASLDQFQSIGSDEELMAVQPGGNYVAVTRLIRAVNDASHYRPGDTEYELVDNLVSGYEPIFNQAGWRIDFSAQAEPFNKVPGDMSRVNDADKVRVYFTVKAAHMNSRIVVADIAAIEVLDLNDKVIGKKSL